MNLKLTGRAPRAPFSRRPSICRPARIVPLATAEMRLEPDLEPVSLLDLLPVSQSTPGDWDLKHAVLSYATALAGALPLAGAVGQFAASGAAESEFAGRLCANRCIGGSAADRPERAGRLRRDAGQGLRSRCRERDRPLLNRRGQDQ